MTEIAYPTTLEDCHDEIRFLNGVARELSRDWCDAAMDARFAKRKAEKAHDMLGRCETALSDSEDELKQAHARLLAAERFIAARGLTVDWRSYRGE